MISSSYMPVIGFIAILAIFVGILGFVALGGRRGDMVTMETTETNPSEYRSATLSHVSSVIHFWLEPVITAEPRYYSADDYSFSCIEYTTMNGFVRCKLVWKTGRVICTYSLHNRLCDEYGDQTVHCSIKRDAKLVKFLMKVRELEFGIYKPALDMAEQLNDIAVFQTSLETVKGQHPIQALCNMYILLTTALLQSKKPNIYLNSVYIQLVATLRAHYNEEFSQFLDSLKLEGNADEDEEEEQGGE